MRRQPELRPRALGGVLLPLARALRVRVEPDGALVVVHPGGRIERRAEPDEVSRAVFLDRHELPRSLQDRDFLHYGGAIVLLRGEQPLLTLLALDWTPPGDLSGADLRRAAGVEALLSALGLPLEPLEPGEELDPARLQASLLRSRPAPPAPGRLAPWSCALAIALAFLGWPLGGTAAGWLLAAAGLVLALAPTTAVLRGRRAARAAAAQPWPERDWTVVASCPSGRLPAGTRDLRVGVSGQDVVVVLEAGREVWLPGPQAGGAATADVAEDAVVVRDERGDALAVLDGAAWCADADGASRLAADLSAAGLPARSFPVPIGRAQVLSTSHWLRLGASQALSDAERGEPTRTTPWLAFLAMATVLTAGLFALAWSVPAGLALVGPAGLLCALQVREAHRRRRADRAGSRLLELTPQQVAR